MKGYDAEKACAFIVSQLDPKMYRSIKNQLHAIVADLIAYDLHFMRLTGVLDENGEQGDNDYDDDEAFEYIYDAWLSDHPQEDDDEMIIAALINDYMDLQYEFLQQNGLADV